MTKATANKTSGVFRRNTTIWIAMILFAGIFALSNCISRQTEKKEDIRGEEFAGSLQCKNCHQQVYDSYLQTAHYNTSSDVSTGSIKGSFEPGKNSFEYPDSLRVMMEKNGGRFYQTVYQQGVKIESHPFDIVIGSGRKAQTFLYYDSTSIFQLPISYFVTAHAWANSPGYPSNTPKFDRFIPSTCFGCHSSFIQVNRSPQKFQLQDEYEKGKLIYGIDCERCHGPAAAHVDYHTAHPGEKEGKELTKIRTLTRTQKNDMCGLCHSGLKDVQQSLFHFKPGDALSKYYFPDVARTDAGQLDVHGNQMQLMMASKCFNQSENLTCGSCHNVHVKERNDLSVFSQRCMNCHKQVIHSFERNDPAAQALLQKNCIDCHMPLQASSTITLLTKQKQKALADSIRTHLVKVYPTPIPHPHAP